jgi:CP family cyanate transporter-like MFS transporter
MILFMSTDHSATARPSALMTFLPMLVIVVLAINLRPTLTATGPLLEEISMSTGLGLQAASLLTVLPMLCMGIFPLLLPWLGRRLSESAWIISGLLTIALANLWRLILDDGLSLIATALLAGTGIAVVQAIAPGVVKRWYPQRVPLAMGIYSASLMVGGGLAAILSPMVAHHYGSWQIGLSIWMVPAILAIVLWWFRPKETLENKDNSGAMDFFSNRRAWLLAGHWVYHHCDHSLPCGSVASIDG